MNDAQREILGILLVFFLLTIVVFGFSVYNFEKNVNVVPAKSDDSPEIEIHRYRYLEDYVKETPEIKSFVLEKYMDGTISTDEYQEIKDELTRLRADDERREINQIMLRLLDTKEEK